MYLKFLDTCLPYIDDLFYWMQNSHYNPDLSFENVKHDVTYVKRKYLQIV